MLKLTIRTKPYRWGQIFLLAVELAIVFLLILGGCYPKQNYRVLAPQNSQERLDRCNVVVEGRVVNVGYRTLDRWQQYVFFCWPFDEGMRGPDRYDVFIEIDQVLKGDQSMPRRMQINSCRPLSPEENALFSRASGGIPDNVRLRIGFNQQHGNSYSNLVVVPLGQVPASVPTTKPAYQLIPSAPAGH